MKAIAVKMRAAARQAKGVRQSREYWKSRARRAEAMCDDICARVESAKEDWDAGDEHGAYLIIQELAREHGLEAK